MLRDTYANVATICPYAIEISPINFDWLSSSSIVDSKEILFVGGFDHTPNRVGLEWFVDEVLPLCPVDLRLHVVGSCCPRDLESKLKSLQRIVFHGFTSDEDLRSLLNRIKVSIAPLPYGAGIKGKVVEALASGHTVIGSEYGIEGMESAPKSSYMQCTTPQQYADAIGQVFQRSNQEWLTADQAAKSFVMVHFSKERIKSFFSEQLGNPMRTEGAQIQILAKTVSSQLNGIVLKPSSYGIEKDGWLLRRNQLVIHFLERANRICIASYVPEGSNSIYRGELELYIKVCYEGGAPLSFVHQLVPGGNQIFIHFPSSVSVDFCIVELDPAFIVERPGSDDHRDLIMLIDSITAE